MFMDDDNLAKKQEIATLVKARGRRSGLRSGVRSGVRSGLRSGLRSGINDLVGIALQCVIFSTLTT